MKTADPTLLNDADFSAQVTPERVEKPSSRWRNKWRALFDKDACEDCGSAECDAGTVYWECCGDEYESKDLAETAAYENLTDDLMTDGEYADEYLGAHAVEGDA